MHWSCCTVVVLCWRQGFGLNAVAAALAGGATWTMTRCATEQHCGPLRCTTCSPPLPPPTLAPQVRRNRHVEILPLSTGCLGACTYCKTKHARGQLGSYALEALVARAREAAADPQVGAGVAGACCRA